MTALKQAVAIAAMCLNEEPSVRPLIRDVVSALSFLGTDANSPNSSPSSIPSPPTLSDQQQAISNANLNLDDDDTTTDRQRAVAEAIEWGTTSRATASS